MKCIGFSLVAMVIVSTPSFSQSAASSISESRVTVDTVYSFALENNFLGDSPDRPVSIYLPPGYDSSPTKHYPVVYFLHSYYVDHTAFFGGDPWNNVDFKLMCDDLIGSGEIKPMIVVSPNAYNQYGGSHYTNSSVTGNWADFLVDDLIGHMDSKYRTIKQKEGRGIAGHSMGGYGAMWTIMNHPSVYNAVYSLSGHPEFGEAGETMCAAANAPSLEGLGWWVVVNIAIAAAISPDSTAPPFYCQFPVNKECEPIDSIWQIFLQSEPLNMLPSMKDSLLQVKAIKYDVGSNDLNTFFVTGNRNFSQAMTELEIPHVFEEFNGGHSDKLTERIKTSLLPFFSANLEHAPTVIAADIHESGISVYPNPTSSLVTFESNSSERYHIEISSLNGQQISRFEEEGSTFQLDLSNYQKGVYFITIRFKDSVTTKKIIKL